MELGNFLLFIFFNKIRIVENITGNVMVTSHYEKYENYVAALARTLQILLYPS